MHWLTLVMAILLTMPQAQAATYLIQLNNRGEFKTSQYWEEGNDIKFYIYGGVAGIQKEFVKTIKQVDEEPALLLPTDQQLSDTVKTEDKKAVEKADRKDRQAEKIDIKHYKEKKLALKKDFNATWQKYIDATDSKDLEAKQRASDEMVGFSRQIYELADELKEKNQGVLPDWWEKEGL